MNRLRNEISANYAKFSEAWKSQLATVTASLDSSSNKFAESYIRITSLQAWRSELLESLLPTGALAFYIEAHNEMVASHVLAQMGWWQQALKSLRSMLENVMHALYYKDHPVELDLWHKGTHRLERHELIKYFSQHPLVLNVPPNVRGLQLINDEYSMLSKAVHASSQSFRMSTDAGQLLLCTDARDRLGAWVTREKRSIQGANLLLLTIFRESLGGTQRLNLRSAISLALPASIHQNVRKHLRVSLPGV